MPISIVRAANCTEKGCIVVHIAYPSLLRAASAQKKGGKVTRTCAVAAQKGKVAHT
jgi:hypothetical protein